jgi:hypothetical protein
VKIARVEEISDEVEDRNVIELRSGQYPEAVDRAEDILVEQAEQLRLFQRGSELVRIIRLDGAQAGGGLHREAGTVMLVPVTAIALTEILDRLVIWKRVSETDEGPKTRRVNCPNRVAAAYLSRVGSWQMPMLAGITSASIVRFDGSVLCRAGYDAATGLLLTEDWPELKETPSRDDALAALGVLLDPYSEFPFVADEDKSVLIAAFLTAVQRRLLTSAPLFAFKAPTQRTGKTLLAECVAIMATGRPAPAMAVSGDREEIRKAVLAALREGHSVVNLDNIEHPLGSPDLSRAITQSEYSDRVLQETRILRLPTNVLWTATGNNLAFRGDLAVRTLMCRLDAKVERPEERQFRIADLKQYVTQHRRKLVAAAITILRAYFAAGKPTESLNPWGGFDQWSATIRAPLVWLGMADPCTTRQHVIEDDPDREQAAAVFSEWSSALGNELLPIAQVIERAASNPALNAALISVGQSKDERNIPYPRKVSWWCRKWRDRVVDRLTLVKGKDYGKAATWRVVEQGECGISRINGIKNPSTKSMEASHQADAGIGIHPRENNPTNPTNPKNDPQPVSSPNQFQCSLAVKE